MAYALQGNQRRVNAFVVFQTQGQVGPGRAFAPPRSFRTPGAGTGFASTGSVMPRLARAGAAPCERSAVHVRLLRVFAAPSYRPPLLPGVALEVIALSQRADASFDEVTRVLEHDPVLAAKVLAIAQSSLYRSRSPVLSLRQAAVRLGLATLRNLVVEASLAVVFDVPGYERSLARLSWHSTVTAYLIRAVARRGAVDPEYAFLCGLLHDVGIAACLLAMSSDPRGPPVPFEALAPVLDDVHQEASGVLTRLWGLPPEIQRVVATHHQLVVGGTPDPLNAHLMVAEHLAGELGAAMQPAIGPADPGASPGAAPLDSNPQGAFDAACGVLGLGDAALRALRAEAAEVVASLAAHPALRRDGGAADR